MHTEDTQQGSTVTLTEHEERNVKELSPPRAAVVFETVRREGELELERPWISLASSGFAAGLSMGMSLVGQGLLQSLLPAAVWRPLVVSLGYTLGFLLVILGRQQLFTENTVTAILPLLDGKNKWLLLKKVARLWAIVLAANLVGAAVFAQFIAHSPVFSDTVKDIFLHIGQAAAAPSFFDIVSRGIFAGWLIALMVWLLPGAHHSKLWVIMIITYFVGLGAFSHIIAGSIEVLYVWASGKMSLMQYVTSFLLPVFLGNVIGGISLVSLLNYGQVMAESESPEA